MKTVFAVLFAVAISIAAVAIAFRSKTQDLPAVPDPVRVTAAEGMDAKTAGDIEFNLESVLRAAGSDAAVNAVVAPSGNPRRPMKVTVRQVDGKESGAVVFAADVCEAAKRVRIAVGQARSDQK